MVILHALLYSLFSLNIVLRTSIHYIDDFFIITAIEIVIWTTFNTTSDVTKTLSVWHFCFTEFTTPMQPVINIPLLWWHICFSILFRLYVKSIIKQGIRTPLSPKIRNRQMTIMLYKYKSRLFQNTSNRETMSYTFRDMCSSTSGPATSPSEALWQYPTSRKGWGVKMQGNIQS